MTMIPLVCLAGALLVGQTGESPALRRFDETQRHMGTEFTIQVYAADEAVARAALQEAFARIGELDRMMTDYDPASELSRLGASSPHDQPVPVSPDLWKILRTARDMSRASDGAFDVTVGPLTRLWRQARRQKRIPDEDRLKQVLASVGYQHLLLSDDPDQPTVQLTKPGMRLDLGGIAQGYAADEALAVLQRHGLTRALINASGDIVAGDPPPGEKGWKVGLTALSAEKKPTQLVLLPPHHSISTSGDAFQFVEFGGKRYSHIVDPRTGIGLTTPMSVTVVCAGGTRADALASALCVLGPERGMKQLVDGQEVHALYVYQAGDEVKTVPSPDFAKQFFLP